MSTPPVTWNTKDIDFDAEGRLVIKNPELIQAIRDRMRDARRLTILTNPQPNPVPDPPNDMCGCIAAPDPRVAI